MWTPDTCLSDESFRHGLPHLVNSLCVFYKRNKLNVLANPLKTMFEYDKMYPCIYFEKIEKLFF